MKDNASSACDKCNKEISNIDAGENFSAEGARFDVKALAKVWSPGETLSVAGRVSKDFYEKYNFVCTECYTNEEDKEFSRGKKRKFYKNLKEILQVVIVVGGFIYLLNINNSLLASVISVIAVLYAYSEFERSRARERKDGDSIFVSQFEKAMFWNAGKSKSETEAKGEE